MPDLRVIIALGSPAIVLACAQAPPPPGATAASSPATTTADPWVNPIGLEDWKTVVP